MCDVLVVKLTTTTETGKFVNGQSDRVKGDQQPEPDIQESEIEVPECCHWPIPGIAALPPPTYQHSGFSVDAGVRIEAHDRAALERLLRYCARPPFAMDRLRKEGAALVYRCTKQHSEPSSDKRGARADELHLTPLELIARIAALVPPPRTHRHRYFGVLAPNSPLRAAVTALAAPAQVLPLEDGVQIEPADWDLAAQAAPDFEVDQRISW